MENEKEISYSKAIAELEELVRKMQSDDCDIDNLSKYTARSIELLKLCRAKLTHTDEELKKCLEEL
jgi:exodeoxyribonuclease VII small subunit